MRTMISGAAACALWLAVPVAAISQATAPQGAATLPSPAQAPQTSGNKVTRMEGGKVLYTVVDGYNVDSNTMNGFRAWRAAACDRCHGANQQGLVGPSLIESLKTLTKDQFITTVREGRLEKGMPSWKSSKMVTENIDNLYAYLKGRSNGDITRAHVQELKP